MIDAIDETVICSAAADLGERGIVRAGLLQVGVDGMICGLGHDSSPSGFDGVTTAKRHAHDPRVSTG